MKPPGAILRSYEFRREREASWRELEGLVERAEKAGVRALDADEIGRLPVLYRATLSSLSVARAISLDRNVVEYLESLSARAYLCVYSSHTHLRHAIAEFFLHTFPRAVRAARWQILVAAAFLVAGTAAGAVFTGRQADLYYAFVSDEMADGRNPASTTASLEAVLYDSADAASMLHTFATFLFTHNATIGILAFALGFLLGLPVFYLMFVNGLSLGAMSALYGDRGLGLEFWAWVLPHGVTELLAVALCGGAGLVLGQSLVAPGRHTRLANLALRGPAAAQVVLGAVAMFLLAALIEGFFRQLVHSVPLRLAVAVATAALWVGYFTLAGRGGGPRRPPGRTER